jgi:hypothetical protein
MRNALVLSAALLALAIPRLAHADYQVRSPDEIDLGEIEIESNGDAVIDNREDHTGATSYTAELGTGLTPWWHAELELGMDRDPGFDEPTLVREAVFENTFQFTSPGENFVDVGFYFEYSQSLTRNENASSNSALFGPLFQKDIGRTTETLNLLLERQFGPNQDAQGMDFSYAFQSRWNLWGPLSPGIEIYGDTGTFGAPSNFQDQQLLVGPVIVGALPLSQLGLGHAGQFKYNLGYLVGATNGSDRGTFKWNLEVEIPF